jgi:hypothetical protein
MKDAGAIPFASGNGCFGAIFRVATDAAERPLWLR